MIVLDASALSEYLVFEETGETVAQRLDAHGSDVHIPHLCTVETVSVLRSLVRRGLLDGARAVAAINDIADFSAVRHAHEPFLPRVWDLRQNFSAYDAVYVALAEALGATLLTCDARLGRAPLTDVSIEVISRPSKN